jgi:5'-methylthioadenosine phosphorylase
MPGEKKCACGDALKYAILTDRKTIPAEVRQRLGLLLDKYLQA